MARGTILTETHAMRHLILAVAPVLLAACAPAQTKQIAAQSVPAPAPACGTAAGPLLVVDGAVQSSACSAATTESAPTCAPAAPIYVVDGVRSCARP